MIESIDYRSLKVSKYPSSSLRPCPRELSQPRPPATLAPPPLSVPRKQKCTPASRAVHLVQRPQAGPRVHPSRPFLCTHSQGSDATTAAWPEGSAPATTKTRPPGWNCTSLSRASLVRSPLGADPSRPDRSGHGWRRSRGPTTLFSPATTARRLSPAPSRRRIAARARRVRSAARSRGHRSCWSRARSPVTDSPLQRPRPPCARRVSGSGCASSSPAARSPCSRSTSIHPRSCPPTRGRPGSVSASRSGAWAAGTSGWASCYQASRSRKRSRGTARAGCTGRSGGPWAGGGGWRGGEGSGRRGPGAGTRPGPVARWTACQGSLRRACRGGWAVSGGPGPGTGRAPGGRGTVAGADEAADRPRRPVWAPPSPSGPLHPRSPTPTTRSPRPSRSFGPPARGSAPAPAGGGPGAACRARPRPAVCPRRPVGRWRSWTSDASRGTLAHLSSDGNRHLTPSTAPAFCNNDAELAIFRGSLSDAHTHGLGTLRTGNLPSCKVCSSLDRLFHVLKFPSIIIRLD